MFYDGFEQSVSVFRSTKLVPLAILQRILGVLGDLAARLIFTDHFDEFVTIVSFARKESQTSPKKSLHLLHSKNFPHIRCLAPSNLPPELF